MSFEAFLSSSSTAEWGFPILMIVAGVISIFFHSFLKRAIEKQTNSTSQSYSHFHLQSILDRFEQRQKISWLLTAVGIIWLSLGIVSEVVAKMN